MPIQVLEAVPYVCLAFVLAGLVFLYMRDRRHGNIYERTARELDQKLAGRKPKPETENETS